jgi:nitrilase
MFVIGCCTPLHIKDIPDRFDFKKLYPEDVEWINSGRSCVIDPQGKIIAGPVENKEEIIYADIDLELITAAKRMFDVAGHYARSDVFKFAVNQRFAERKEVSYRK